MVTNTVRLNDEELRALNDYVELYNIPLSMLFNQALEKRIKDSLYLGHIKQYEDEIEDRTTPTNNHDIIIKNIKLIQ